MTKPYTILTDNGAGAFGLPSIEDISDKVISTDDAGNPVRISDLTEAERQAIGIAALTVEDTAGYTPGAASEALSASGVARTYPGKTLIPVTVGQVQAEAERRITAGTTISGVQFKCDDQSTNRLEGMHGRFVRAEAASESYSATFRTESGAEVTITSAAQAQAILDAAIDYVALILSKSAALQAMDPIPQDYTDNRYWSV